jgi:hypothetical protein
MTIQQHIDQLRSTPSTREQDRVATYNTIKEMEATLGFLVVEIHDAQVIVTR